MRTVEQARQEAVARLKDSEYSEVGPVVLIDSKTEEFDAGWVYFYQSTRYMKNRDPRDGLLGNAPLFVPRSGAPIQVISLHRPTPESVEAFLCCGNANAPANPEIELSGWREGALKVSATQAIRDCSSLGLGAAKDVVDRCLSGRSVKVQTSSIAAARELSSKLTRLRFIARVTYGG